MSPKLYPRHHEYVEIKRGSGLFQCDDCGKQQLITEQWLADCPGPAKPNPPYGAFQGLVASTAAQVKGLVGHNFNPNPTEPKACTCVMHGPDGLMARGCQCGGG